MKILEVNKLYYPWIGGIEQTTQDIAEGLKNVHEITVLVCQPRGRGREEPVNGVQVVRAGSFGIVFGMPLSVSFFYHFYRLARVADIIHIHFPFPLALCAYLLFGTNKRAIITWHSDIVRYCFLRNLLAPLVKRALKSVCSITVTSPRLLEYTPILRPHLSKCTVVPSAIDIKKTVSHVEKFSLPGLGANNKMLLSVGRLVYYKGFFYAIDAMKNVDAKLYIVGDGPLRSMLEERIKEHGLGDRVFILGSIPLPNLNYCYQRCDAFVFPSIASSEAFGLVQLEAMAHGKPVVNTDLPTGVPWVSLHNVSGLTVPAGDASALSHALTTLLQDTALYRRLAQGARERAALFTKEQMIEQYHQLFVRCMNAHQ